MGYRVHLIAVTGKEPEAIHRDFGVSPTGQREDIPESPVIGAQLPNGAYLLYVNDGISPSAQVFARLSRDASLVACDANETVMTSYACGWVDGVERWVVFHDSQNGIRDLEVTGTPPKELQPIRDRFFALQEAEGGEDADTDYVFDIPVELFAALGGIRYDQDIPDAGPEPWEILERR